MLDRSRILAALSLVAAAALLAACGQLMAGTSTTAENTVTGVARMPGGGPAAGARVAARGEAVVLSRGRAPEARLLAQAAADSTGRFSLPVPKGVKFYLEIRPSDSSSVSWFRDFTGPAPAALALGQVTLEPTVMVKGTLRDAKGNWNTRAWIGVAGTDLFRAVSSPAESAAVAFSLPAAPAGARALAIYVEPMTQGQDPDRPLPVDTASYPGGGPVREAGEILFGLGD